MEKLYNVSSNPHTRSPLTTQRVMLEVILALLPATAVGIYTQGIPALTVIAASIAAAVLSEYLFCAVTKRPNTARDLSAVVTGLLLALCLPASVPIYVPILGAVFAVIVVKCLFGGLGKNFMNPALAGRCFVLISFSGVVTTFKVDAVSVATPLADLAAGSQPNVWAVLLGNAAGVIGCSALGLIIGGLFLLIIGGITWEIPVSVLAAFTAFIVLFGGHGLEPAFLLTHISAGGILMAAFFMATDPVTSPVTSKGQLIYGAFLGIIAALFRLYGTAADSVSYAVIIANLIVPLIDANIVDIPYGHRAKKEKKEFPMAAVTLCAITVIVGIALSGTYALTKDAIEEQQIAANAASYKEVFPEAASFAEDEVMAALIESFEGNVYGTDFGKAYINTAIDALDESGNVIGYVISATSGDGFDGNITLSVGISKDGTVNGISFTELNETAGMGMRCGEDEFKDQFAGVTVSQFTLNKAGGSTADDEIDSVSGASISSGAVVNAVNAALDFCASAAS